MPGEPSYPPEIQSQIERCPRAQGIPQGERKDSLICNLEGWCKGCTSRKEAYREWDSRGDRKPIDDYLAEFGEEARRFLRLSFPIDAAPLPTSKGENGPGLREVFRPGLLAAQRTIARVFELGGRENAWGQIGAYVRYDPWGLTRPGWEGREKRPEWPNWAPSIEMLLPLVRIEGSGVSRLQPRASSLSALDDQNVVDEGFRRFYEEEVKARQGKKHWRHHRQLHEEKVPSVRVQTPPPGRAQKGWTEQQLEQFSRSLFDWPDRGQITGEGRARYRVLGWGHRPEEGVVELEAPPFQDILDIVTRCDGDMDQPLGQLAPGSG